MTILEFILNNKDSLEDLITRIIYTIIITTSKIYLLKLLDIISNLKGYILLKMEMVELVDYL